MKQLPLGPLMIDIAGTTLCDLDRERLLHSLVGGLILFSRNYASPAQLEALCAEVHALRDPPLPIAVDHEGGRVQRFRDGFTRLPAMRCLGEWWDRDPAGAIEAAHGIGYVLAAELRARGVDFSFTPVLDLDWARSAVIGDRAFHRDAIPVSELATALMAGLRDAGMGSCGKHFPGHGWVAADSHVAIPIDERALSEIELDMKPYGLTTLAAVMPAHVIYPRVDERPAGFSPVWIGKLRGDYHFDGVIFSDDLSMEGAAVAGGIVDRAHAAWGAGCDMLLVCNAPDSVGELLERWRPNSDPVHAQRVQRLLPVVAAIGWDKLQKEPRYLAGLRAIEQLGATK